MHRMKIHHAFCLECKKGGIYWAGGIRGECVLSSARLEACGVFCLSLDLQERGALCDPQHVPPVADGCLAVVERIRFYKPGVG